MRGRFNREALPNPFDYYSEHLVKFKGRSSGLRAFALCPFHEDKRPSFTVHLEKGSYYCYSCQEKGSDVIHFHMRKYGYSFMDAIKDLGAWQ